MNTPILEPHLNQVDETLGDTYLKIKLNQQTPAALAMDYAQEVLIVPHKRITPIPNMPKCVLGLLNRRNRVLWVVDLAQMLNLGSVEANVQQYHMAIIQVGQISVCLVVQEIIGVTRLENDSIQSSIGLVIPNINPYIHGYILQQKEILLVLNMEAIISLPVFNNS